MRGHKHPALWVSKHRAVNTISMWLKKVKPSGDVAMQSIRDVGWMDLSVIQEWRASALEHNEKVQVYIYAYTGVFIQNAILITGWRGPHDLIFSMRNWSFWDAPEGKGTLPAAIGECAFMSGSARNMPENTAILRCSDPIQVLYKQQDNSLTCLKS